MAFRFDLPESLWRPDLYYWLATLNWQAYGAADAEITATLNQAGSNTWFWLWPRPTGRTNAIVALYDDWLVIALEGTRATLTEWGTSAFQWTENILGALQDLGSTGVPGQVHFGWGNDTLDMKNRLLPLLPRGDAAPDRKVLLAGHSRGGAMAQILGHMLNDADEYTTRGVVTFGCPRVGNREFARAPHWPVVCLANALDPVPHLPPGLAWRIPSTINVLTRDLLLLYEHGGHHWVLSADGSRSDGTVDALRGISTPADVPLLNNGGLQLTNHFMEQYILRLRAHLPQYLRTLKTDFNDLCELDGINGPAVRASGYEWPFPVTCDTPPGLPLYSGPPLTVPPTPWWEHVCLGGKGRGCCKDRG